MMGSGLAARGDSAAWWWAGFWSGRLACQVPDPHEIVDGGGKGEDPIHPPLAAVPRLAEQPDGLEPAEDLLDELALALAHQVTGVAHGAAVDPTGPVRRVLGHVLRHVERPEGLDELARVIAFVGPRASPGGAARSPSAPPLPIRPYPTLAWHRR
jgi:hypothetical protein